MNKLKNKNVNFFYYFSIKIGFNLLKFLLYKFCLFIFSPFIFHYLNSQNYINLNSYTYKNA